MDKCKCIDIDFPFYNASFSSCMLNAASSNCNEKQLQNTQSNYAFEEMCEKLCPYECDAEEFSYTLTGNEVKPKTLKFIILIYNSILI